SLTLFGLALTAFVADAGFAQAQQSAPAQNPFGATAQPSTTGPKKPRAAPALKSGQFASEAEAKASCPGDSVVWAHTGTKVYHKDGTAAYGTTSRGAYMCEKDTAAAGVRAAKNEKRKKGARSARLVPPAFFEIAACKKRQYCPKAIRRRLG